MRKVLATTLMVIGSVAVASAQIRGPEIDPASSASAVGILAGCLLMLGAPRKK